MTRQADRNAERQDPKGLGPEGMRAAACEADAPNTSLMDKTVEVSQAARDAVGREKALVSAVRAVLAELGTPNGYFPDIGAPLTRALQAAFTAYEEHPRHVAQ